LPRLLPLSLYSPRDHPALPSFPTRRSSDLHVLLVGDGARAFAHAQGLRECDPESLVTPRQLARHQERMAAMKGTVGAVAMDRNGDRKSTRLNSSHLGISYAVFCLKKKKRK